MCWANMALVSGLKKYFPEEPGSGPPASNPGRTPDASTIYERMRLALEELGPTFVKFGQIMSTRTELLPPELIEELKKLQDHAKPLPFSEVREVIEQNCTPMLTSGSGRSMKYRLHLHR